MIFYIKSELFLDLLLSKSDASKAKLELGWETKRTIEDICRDGCRFAMNIK